MPLSGAPEAALSSAVWQEIRIRSGRDNLVAKRELTREIINLKINCHPDRSEAKWRDLRFSPPATGCTWEHRPLLCHPERSRVAVLSTSIETLREAPPTVCHPKSLLDNSDFQRSGNLLYAFAMVPANCACIISDIGVPSLEEHEDLLRRFGGPAVGSLFVLHSETGPTKTQRFRNSTMEM